jgi:heptosyltransferase-2
MSILSGARWRIGFYLPQLWRTLLVNVPVYFNYARHILEIYGMVGSAVGVEVNNKLFTSIPVEAEDKVFVGSLFSRIGIKENDFLVSINVNASELALCRRWPKEKFAEVINACLKKYSTLKILLTGNSDEAAYTASILEFLDITTRDRVFDISGVLKFTQFIALLSKIDIFLSNDTGPFHLARAQRTPTISIWGPGSPDLYGPFGEDSNMHKVVYKRWPCSPCMYMYRTNAGFFCRSTTPCLVHIDSKEVMKVVMDMIDELTDKEYLPNNA